MTKTHKHLVLIINRRKSELWGQNTLIIHLHLHNDRLDIYIKSVIKVHAILDK